MKLRTSVIVLCASLLAGFPAARGDVLAHGTGDSYWLAAARRQEEGKVQTLVQYRPLNSGVSWRTIAVINSRIHELTHLGREAVALLDNGEWMILRDGSSSTGVLPTDGSRLMHLTGDSQTLWGVAEARMGRPPTTSGATQPATTMPANTRLLYRLERGNWQLLARLPNVAQDAVRVSLAPVDRSIMLAVLLEDGRVETFRFEEDGRNWESTGSVGVPPGMQRIKLLGGLGRPTLWAAGADGVGVLAWRDGQWGEPAALAMPGTVGPADDVTVAGRNSIRVLVESDGKISEYAFDASGASQGAPVDVPPPVMPREPEDFDWLTGVAAAALLIVLMNTMQRREPVTPESLTKVGVRLAPFVRRGIGGLIDALPVIGTLGVYLVRGDFSTTEQIEATSQALTIPTYITMSIYILHTLVCEMLWGWSIGKRIVGIRVAMIDGSAPTTRAIVLRNLMRVLDVMMLFVPLLIMFLSPLRQRVGDIVAETIVIQDDGTRPPPPDRGGIEDDAGPKE